MKLSLPLARYIQKNYQSGVLTPKGLLNSFIKALLSNFVLGVFTDGQTDGQRIKKTDLPSVFLILW